VRALTGNDAVALAFKQIDPHVAAAYPITPQTELMHKFAEYVARREVRTELVNTESEHSAMSAALAASAAGCRTFTATSANGLAYMIEAYHNAGALRLPIVLALVNRHVGGLLNIHNDHSDAMLARNAAWLQLHAETSQEAYDNTIQAFRIAEDDRVQLPVTICHDGFVVSHTMERLLVLTDEQVRDFVGDYVPPVDLLDTSHPHAVGPLVMPDFAMRLYAQISEAMRWAPGVIEEIGHEYGRLTGRSYGLFESYRLDDAEVAIVAMGSVCGTVRAVVDLLRTHGVRAGMLKLRVFRPFPANALARALSGADLKAIAVLDKTTELGSGGPLFAETVAALAVHHGSSGQQLPVLLNAIVGIGGRDITLTDVNAVFCRLLDAANGASSNGDPVLFVDIGEQGERVLKSGDDHGGAAAPASTIRNVVFIARGGQGAKIASHLVAELMIEAGKYAQALPIYGPERTGAPIKAFAKISDQPIDDRQQIYAADVVVLFDEHLLEEHLHDVQNLTQHGVVIVNTRRSPAELRDAMGLAGRRVWTVDATGIAMAEIGVNRPNTVLMATTLHALGIDDLAPLKNAFRSRMARLSEKALQGNCRAMDRAAGETRRE
jgi:pyruvate ferredoxin oxidoreductase alpha subunit